MADQWQNAIGKGFGLAMDEIYNGLIGKGPQSALRKKDLTKFSTDDLWAATNLIPGGGAAKVATPVVKSGVKAATTATVKSVAPKKYIYDAAKAAYKADPGAGWGSQGVRTAAEDAALRIAENKARIARGMRQKQLLELIGSQDKTFKNVFQTGTTTGHLTKTNRKAAEELIFGADNVEKLNYGYVALPKPLSGTPFVPQFANGGFLPLKSTATDFYGDTAVLFKKGASKNATVTYGDSGAQGAAEAVLYGKDKSAFKPVPFNEMASKIDEAGRANFREVPRVGGLPYIEAQWTKPLSIKDVSKIFAPSATKPEIEAALKAAGIRKKVVAWEDLNKPGVIDKMKAALAQAKAKVEKAAADKRREEAIKNLPRDATGRLIVEG